MLDLRRGYEQIRAEILTAIEHACDSQQFVLGEQVAAFEREAAAFLGVPRAVACASGTDALWLALLGIGIEAGDVVITTPFSFFATVSSIVRAGARPVLADIEEATLNLDPEQVEKCLRRRHNVKAIMPVHLYGQCADMAAFARLGRDYGVKIVEDAAQAFGASWHDHKAGGLGDAAGFSFYPTKNLSAFGDGGMVTTDNTAVAERITMLRNHGSRRRYHHEALGANSRMDGIQGAVLRVKLKHVARWNEQRRARAAKYDRLFAEAGLPQVKPLATAPPAYHIFHQYVIRVERRDDLRQFLAARRIGSEVYYPLPLHLQPCFTYLGYREGELPVAERAACDVLALPMFPEITDDEQQRVVSAIADFYS